MLNQDEEHQGLNTEQEEPTTAEIQFKQISMNSAKVRIAFIRKVYVILLTQVACTVALITLAIFYSPYQNFLQNNLWLLNLSAVMTLIIAYSLSCYKEVARSVPKNFILLGLFTIFESISVSYVTCQYNHQVILTAAVLTLFMFIGLTAYAFKTKTDFTYFGGLLFTLLCLLIGIGFLTLFIHIKILQIVYSFISLMLFSVYLIYDTQLIVGQHSSKFEIDDYILASLNIYLDLIIIFLDLLRLLSPREQ